jgi:DUF917 family protein
MQTLSYQDIVNIMYGAVFLGGGGCIQVWICCSIYGRNRKNKRKVIAYSLVIEMGGGNSYIAMLVSPYENIPIIDTDCSGRTVPSLEIVLAAVNGNQISPAVVVDVNNKKITIEPENQHNANHVEKIGRAISESSQVGCTLSVWTVSKSDIVKTLLIGTIRCTMIPGSDPGFDTGFLSIEDSECLYKINSQNENLIIS